jgi:tetratricopeptide (TPR) repeat protein
MILTSYHRFSAAMQCLWIPCLLAVTSCAAYAATPGDVSQGGVAGTVAAQEQAATPVAEGPPSLVSEPRKLGMEAYEKGELPKAVEYLTAAHTLEPKDAEVSGRLGFALKETGAYEKAVAVLREATQTKPDDYYYWWWLSDAQRLLGQYKEALESMAKSRDVAPKDVSKDLQQYVDYTATLADRNASWENFAQHIDFAERHRKNRRVRRQIAEYSTALDIAPPVTDANTDGLKRLVWINQEMGTQYNYIEEPEVAVDYFLTALDCANRGDLKADAMRNHQNLAISWRMLYERAPEKNAPLLEKAITEWSAALDLAKETSDTVYLRYTQGRLLECLALARPRLDPLMMETRAANEKEVPWKGPVNEYSLADAVTGEMACRLAEGDFAGARVLLEMSLPYFEQSNYLSDYQRCVEMYLVQAWLYQKQDHPADALKSLEKADKKAVQAREFVDADAFNRGTGDRLLRALAASKARAHAALGEGDAALSAIDAYKSARLRNLLGSKVVDDAARTDSVSERDTIRRRISWLEVRRDTAKDLNNAEETARIEGRIVQDRTRLAWLDREISFPTTGNLKYEGVPEMSPDTLRASIPEGTVVLDYLFDSRGGVGVAVLRSAATAHLIDATEAALRAAAAKIVPADPVASGPALSELGAKLIGTLAKEWTGSARTIVCTDPATDHIPFDALKSDGIAWDGSVTLSYADSAAQYASLLSAPAVNPARLRAVLAREDRAAMFATPAGGTPPVERKIGAEAVPGALTAGAQPADAVHAACLIDARPTDVMLCPLIFAGEKGAGELPLARLIGEPLPAAVFSLDWAPAVPDMEWRGELLSALTETLRTGGCGTLVTTLWPVDPAVSAAFFDAFYARAGAGDKAGAAHAAREIVRAAFPGTLDCAAFVLRGDPR